MSALIVRLAEAGERYAWDDFVAARPLGHLLQSWEWGDLKGRYGWRVQRLWLEDADQPVAAAQALFRPLPIPGATLAYLPKGPAVDWRDETLAEATLAALRRYCAGTGAALLKVDPDLAADDAAGAALLARAGFRPSSEQVQLRNTMVIDLSPDEEGILAAMKQKWRYNIRLAGRKGVTVRAGGLDDMPRFFDLYKTTAVRDRFVLRDYAYYADAWGSFMQRGLAHMLLAEHDGAVMSGLIVYRFGRAAYYLYGASDDTKRNLMPNHLLQWEAMRWGKSQGCTEYDMWGLPDKLEPGVPMWGVYKFKEGFGGKVVSHLVAHDHVYRPAVYNLYRLALPCYLQARCLLTGQWGRHQGAGE